MNDMLTKHPMDGVRYTKPVRAVDDIKFLTVEEQVTFLETAHSQRIGIAVSDSGICGSPYRSYPILTRAIKSGVMPKVLQKLLCHSSIKTTMDRYVHVTDASLTNAIKQFEQHTILAS